MVGGGVVFWPVCIISETLFSAEEVHGWAGFVGDSRNTIETTAMGTAGRVFGMIL